MLPLATGVPTKGKLEAMAPKVPSVEPASQFCSKNNGGRGGSIVGRGGGSLAKCSMESNDGLGGVGFVVGGRRSSCMSKRAQGEVSMGSMLMDNGKECLDGWVRAGGGEVMGGGVDFRVSRSFLGEIPREIMGDRIGEEFGVDGGTVWY
ncbi:hypothetical protein Tco_0754272 [Tanacetum coccineum]